MDVSGQADGRWRTSNLGAIFCGLYDTFRTGTSPPSSAYSFDPRLAGAGTGHDTAMIRRRLAHPGWRRRRAYREQAG